MKNYTTYSESEMQDALVKNPEQNRVTKTNPSSLINSIWQYIATVFEQRQEPKVWQRCDRYGQTLWYGYDPVTGWSVCRHSEGEIRIWIEERYNR
ncbi:MAG TPA: hypothetical protein V6D11_05955 [Waterburya sp.]